MLIVSKLFTIKFTNDNVIIELLKDKCLPALYTTIWKFVL